MWQHLTPSLPTASPLTTTIFAGEIECLLVYHCVFIIIAWGVTGLCYAALVFSTFTAGVPAGTTMVQEMLQVAAAQATA